MDFADLAILHGKKGVLTKYVPGLEVRERHNIRWKRRVRGLAFPNIQYGPIERVAELLVQASKSGRPDWSQFKRSTLQKALSTLQQLGFIDASSKSIRLQPRIVNFVSSPDKRALIFGQAALQLKSFKIFIETLEKWTDERSHLASLVPEVRKNLGVDWSDSTAMVCVKIMLNWARHTNLAPDRFMRRKTNGTDA
jgi:hypothetical protein